MSDRPRVEVLPIEEGATTDPNNANKHTMRGGTLLENSLRKRGAFRSIASAGKDVKIPVTYAGNYTLEKAVDAGFTEIVNVHVTGNQLVNVVRDDIAPGTAAAIALGLEDNEIGKTSYAPDLDLVAQLAAGDSAILSALLAEDKIFSGMLDNMTPQQIDYQAEWQGMPEFDKENLRAKQQIIVSFKTDNDVQEFAKLIEQNLTEKTRSIWYPERPIELQDQLGTKEGLLFTNES